MKTLALWLYSLAALLALLGGFNGSSLFMGILFFTVITAFLALASLFLVIFRHVGTVKTQVKENREHGKWIL